MSALQAANVVAIAISGVAMLTAAEEGETWMTLLLAVLCAANVYCLANDGLVAS